MVSKKLRILGVEVYSLYGEEFNNINGCDIVAQHLLNLRNKATVEKNLVFMVTDFGEVYYFDYSKYDGTECPIYLKLPSGESKYFAANFYEFLYKYINMCL